MQLKLGFLKRMPGITWVLLLLIIIFSFISPRFADQDNIHNIIRQSTVLAIVSLGMMAAITSGGIDLSVGSLVGLSGVLVAYLVKNGMNWLLAILIGVLVCSFFGMISGLVISKGKVFPFIVTFGMLFMVRSISLGFTQGGSLHIESQTFSMINEGYFLFMPIPFWITLALFIFVLFLMNRSVFGRYIFSIGIDSNGAKWMGINVDLYKTLVYVLSATLAGIAGVVLASRVNTGNALIGQDTQFYAVAAVVIGGTPITGGRGNLTGAVLGALVITIIQNGLTLLGFSSEKTSAIVGLTLVLGVILAQFAYRGETHGER
jgi:ribose transport system permease protein